VAIYNWEDWMSENTKSVVKNVQKQYNYTPPTPVQQYTGSVGGKISASYPDLSKQTPTETAGVYKTSTQIAQENPFEKAWETLNSGFQSLLSTKPFWEPQKVQAETSKKTMEDYQQEGFKTTTPFMPSPDYLADIDRQIEQGTIQNMFTTQYGMTEQGINKIASQMEGNQMVYAGLSTLLNQGSIPDNMQNYITDNDLSSIVNMAAQNNINLPEINPERLSKLRDEGTIATFQNAGYEMTGLYDSVDKYLRDWESENGVDILITKDQLSKLNYESLSELMENLNLLGQSPDEMEDLRNLDKSLTLSLTSKSMTPKGKMLYTTAQWKSVGGMTQSEYNKLQSQQEENDYWSSTSINERNRRREESYEWSKAKDLEGWDAFYKTMNDLKLTPDMDNYFNNPTMFNDLRRQWETSGTNLSWEQWLAQYDFKGTWNKLSPRDRGERPSTFAPRMTGVSEL
jgi:hypothetical protein